MIDPKQLKPGSTGQKLRTINGLVVWAKSIMPFLNIGQSVSYATTGHDDTLLTLSNSPADSRMEVTVNGFAMRIGNGDRNKDCYFVNEHPFVRIAGGGQGTGVSHFLALKNQNAWSWGINTNGVLGDNSATDRSSPISVVGNHNFVFLSHSDNVQLALKSDGTCWSWGTGTNGGLGDNTVTSKSSPISVVGAHSFVLVYGGTQFAIALKSDGTAWTWGNGGNGRLGDNTATSKSSPVSVVGVHVFASVAAGSANSYGLKSDGSAWAWGAGAGGAIGDNTITGKSSPVSVVGAHIFTQISLGTDNSVGALKLDGSAWGWGNNGSGKIGDSTVANKSSPVSVVGAHSFVQISGGGTLRLALKADGSCWAWGSNSGGQLGTNAAPDRSSPVSIVGGHSFISVRAGDTQSLALKIDGSLWAWGNNNSGQLGDNTNTSRSSPVSVVGHPANIVRQLTELRDNDIFIWNEPVAGFDLSTADTIDFFYSA